MPALRYPSLWIMFVMIGFGLGYPTLNRYDASRSQGTADSLQYGRMVVEGPGAADGHWRSRILVPLLARPLASMAAGRVGTWNPVALSLLIVNAAFCAATALALIALAQALGLPFATGLIAAFCWLLNFEVANFHLAGMVDSAEACLMACVALALATRSWKALPLLGAIGGLAKETLAPLAFLFALGWVWREPRKPWLPLAALGAAGLIVVVLLRSVMEGRLVTPLQMASDELAIGGASGLLHAAVRPFTAWVTWLTFLWMLPFARRGMGRLPREALRATAFALAGAFALVVWHDAGSNGARPFFNVAGPFVCLAFAIGITDGSAASLPDTAHMP